MGEKAKYLGGPRRADLPHECSQKRWPSKKNTMKMASRMFVWWHYLGLMMSIVLLQSGDLFYHLMSLNRQLHCRFNARIRCMSPSENLQELLFLLHLLKPTKPKLAAIILPSLLTPEFSIEGSTPYAREKKVRALFVKCVREVSSGWREGITLEWCPAICHKGFRGASSQICLTSVYRIHTCTKWMSRTLQSMSLYL